MLEQEHIQKAEELIANGADAELQEFLDNLHPAELVLLIESSPEEQQITILKALNGLDQLSDVVTYANYALRKTLISLLDDARIAAVIRRIEIDDAADILHELPRRKQVAILKRLPTLRVKELKSLLAYERETAGGIMTTLFLNVSKNESADAALNRLRRELASEEIDSDTDITYCYVVEDQKQLIGVVSLRELLSADPLSPVSDLMQAPVVHVHPNDDQEKVARIIGDYDLSAIPVVSDDGIIQGIITVDDIIDVIEDETTEDILLLAGTVDEDIVGASIRTSIRSRLPWLAVSWIGGTCAALILGSFEEEFRQIVALAFFMPVVFGMGGNVGSQSSTITVRGLATGQFNQWQFLPRLKKEASVGFLLGMIFGALLLVVSYILFQNAHLSAIVGVSIFLTMSVANATGSIVPLLFKKIGIDPAVASGPLVTTSTDILSAIIYFSIAAKML